jgi:hypothetical protein
MNFSSGLRACVLGAAFVLGASSAVAGDMATASPVDGKAAPTCAEEPSNEIKMGWRYAGEEPGFVNFLYALGDKERISVKVFSEQAPETLSQERQTKIAEAAVESFLGSIGAILHSGDRSAVRGYVTLAVKSKSLQLGHGQVADDEGSPVGRKVVQDRLIRATHSLYLSLQEEVERQAEGHRLVLEDRAMLRDLLSAMKRIESDKIRVKIPAEYQERFERIFKFDPAGHEVEAVSPTDGVAARARQVSKGSETNSQAYASGDEASAITDRVRQDIAGGRDSAIIVADRYEAMEDIGDELEVVEGRLGQSKVTLGVLQKILVAMETELQSLNVPHQEQEEALTEAFRQGVVGF